MNGRSHRMTEFLQFGTVSVMWIFSAAITLWVLQLVRVAYELKDSITASFGISLVALPIYWTLAAILTYTFFGLRRTRSSPSTDGDDVDGSAPSQLVGTSERQD
jgi:uncharacterized membrane protein YcjF (UPF0283 family)